MPPWPLVAAAAAAGLVATPHCLAMCSAPCAAVTGGRARDVAWLLVARVAGYAAAGAVAAASLQAFAAWTRAVPALRPAWLFLHLALFMLGVWWLATGRAPARLRGAGVASVRWLRVPAPARPALAGLAWVGWPCGVLQGALALSALASTPAGGAAVMGAFAIASAPALALAPWAWAHLRGRGRVLAARLRDGAGLRLAGATLMAGSGWALARGLWEDVARWCA